MINLRSSCMGFGIAASLISSVASAQTTTTTTTVTGAPPPDATALVAAPTSSAAAPPDLYKPNVSTNATLAAGGQFATGNSRLLAGTVNGKIDLRREANGFGASLLGNYGRGAAAPGAPEVTTAENLQGRIRYDRYLSDRLSIFLIDTERHDRFQGLGIRTNIDPGVKYLFAQEETTTFWGELGYDFQYDVRLDAARVQLDATGAPIPNAPLLAKTATQESGRAYVGFKHAFNSEVTFTTGLEYLQAFTSSTPGMDHDYRLNYDALFAANVAGGFSLGLGFTARYDRDPLPGKVHTDTASTISLIYSFSRPAPVVAPTCPCPPPPPQDVPLATPPPPPAAPPPGALAPGTPGTTTTSTTSTTTTTPAAPPAPPATPTAPQ